MFYIIHTSILGLVLVKYLAIIKAVFVTTSNQDLLKQSKTYVIVRYKNMERGIHSPLTETPTIRIHPYIIRKDSLVPRPFYARSARWERDKGLVPVVRACVEFYWNPYSLVYFSILT